MCISDGIMKMLPPSTLAHMCPYALSSHPFGGTGYTWIKEQKFIGSAVLGSSYDGPWMCLLCGCRDWVPEWRAESSERLQVLEMAQTGGRNLLFPSWKLHLTLIWNSSDTTQQWTWSYIGRKLGYLKAMSHSNFINTVHDSGNWRVAGNFFRMEGYYYDIKSNLLLIFTAQLMVSHAHNGIKFDGNVLIKPSERNSWWNWKLWRLHCANVSIYFSIMWF